PGLRVDLDLADVAAIGEGRLRRGKMAALGKAGLDAGRLLRRVEGGARHLLDAEPAVGTADGEDAVGKFDIRLGRLEEVRGDLAAFGDQLVGGMDEREAPVPRPKAIDAVSPCSTRILSGAMPSRSTASWV